MQQDSSYSASTGGGQVNFYHADGNGNITMMLDSSQATVATYKYDPYGNSFTASGSLASANLYRFSSKLWCANAGLYYYGYRFYDPSLQRWLNQDPIGEAGGINLYSISLNNPVDYVDTDGRWVWIPGFALKAFGVEKAIEKGGKAYYGGKSLIECRDSFLDAKDRLDDKYGDYWPEWAEEYMDQWQKELAGGFGPQVAPVMQGVPGSTMNPIPRQNTR